MKLKNITGTIEIMTGTTIGSQGNIEIGGNDNPTIRNPINNEVYIPGSSIKGKLRSLSEWNLLGYEAISKSGGKVHSCSDPDCSICRVFGKSADMSLENVAGPTRLVVRDAFITQESREKMLNLRKTKGFDTEIKYENTINRLNSMANPRNIERIPSGIKFEFSMTYKIIDGDDEKNFEHVLDALRLVELDGIGGGVSRGNGQVRFDIMVDGVKTDISKRNV